MVFLSAVGRTAQIKDEGLKHKNERQTQTREREIIFENRTDLTTKKRVYKIGSVHQMYRQVAHESNARNTPS